MMTRLRTWMKPVERGTYLSVFGMDDWFHTPQYLGKDFIYLKVFICWFLFLFFLFFSRIIHCGWRRKTNYAFSLINSLGNWGYVRDIFNSVALNDVKLTLTLNLPLMNAQLHIPSISQHWTYIKVGFIYSSGSQPFSHQGQSVGFSFFLFIWLKSVSMFVIKDFLSWNRDETGTPTTYCIRCFAD